jgi:biopolymer transport protein ExbD
VSFLMLIFFLVTSTITKRENDLPMTIPPPGQTSAIPTLPLMRC